MNLSYLVSVKICNLDTGEVLEETVLSRESPYAYEIERTFEELGKRVAVRINPEYYRE
jgi:hypothetical protein